MRSIPLSDLAAAMLLEYSVTRRPSTTVKLRHILNQLGRTISPDPSVPAQTAHLTREGILRWRARACATLSPNTVIGHLGYVRAVVSYAIEEGFLEHEPPWRKLRPKRVRPRDVRHLSLEEAARLLAHLEARAAAGWKERRIYALVATALYAGLRKSELLYLRWADIRLAERIIDVDPHPARALKTEGSAQPVPIAGELVPIIEGWRPCVPPRCEWFNPGTTLEVPWTNGRPGCRPINALQRAAREADIRRPTWQMLRRTWSVHGETRWGLTDPEIMRVLRHTSPETSRRHYREADLDNLRRIAGRISYRE